MMMQCMDDPKKPTPVKRIKAFFCGFAVAIALAIVGAAHLAETKPDSTRFEIRLGEKIARYKEFKAEYDDKDFHLNSYAVNRAEHVNGNLKTYRFDVYHITYGLIADNVKEYGKFRKQIVRNPTISETCKSLVCQSNLYVEEYDTSGIYPKVTCLEEEDSYPISLIFNTLSEEELNDIAIIYQFDDGDMDVQFSLDTGRDKKLVERLFNKLYQADEKKDQNRPAVKMEPIIPTNNQRITVSYIDANKDGEPEFVLIPYCINGSYFDTDPGNNAIQVALKYKLVTRKDLKGKTPLERKTLKDRIGLWMWDKPSEILMSFCENPGPDIVFYDYGKVENSEIVDAKPDGQFDNYKFLY